MRVCCTRCSALQRFTRLKFGSCRMHLPAKETRIESKDDQRAESIFWTGKSLGIVNLLFALWYRWFIVNGDLQRLQKVFGASLYLL